MTDIPVTETPPAALFDRIDTWIFDLDNTLYPASSRLFNEVSKRITAFIAERFTLPPDAARVRQRDFFMRYGTTLRGLMVEHGVDPGPFLDYVHAIDVGLLESNPGLGGRLARLPGRKLVFTNASRRHAERVLDQLGIGPHFEEIFDIAAADYVPKPDRSSYALMLERHNVEPETACMIEDMARNLEPAKALGMRTVWLKGDIEWARRQGADPSPPYVDHIVNDLEHWLDELIARRTTDPAVSSA
jgi:putative hydrolase of the HAD superfamily